MLPNEIWATVSDFLQSITLSHVCRAFYDAFRRRHLRGSCENLGDIQRLLVFAPFVHTVDLGPRDGGQDVGQEDEAQSQPLANQAPPQLMLYMIVEALRRAPMLHTLTLRFPDCDVGPSVGALSGLCSSQALHTLKLNFSCTGVGDDGTEFFAGLARAPKLQALSIDLTGCGVHAKGAARLAGLPIAAPLQRLHLNLAFNALGLSGVQALAMLREAPVLTDLALNLTMNGIGLEGVEALVQLRNAPMLTTLALDFSGNQLGDRAAQVVCSHLLVLVCSHHMCNKGVIGRKTWQCVESETKLHSLCLQHCALSLHRANIMHDVCARHFFR